MHRILIIKKYFSVFIFVSVYIISTTNSFSQAPDFQWINHAGSPGYTTGEKVAVDNKDNIIVTGYFDSTITFGNTTFTSYGSADIFIAKYDPSGKILWARQAGGSNYDNGFGVATDKIGNIVITGSFSSASAKFDGLSVRSVGGSDVFVAKYDPNGKIIWAKTAGGKLYDVGYGVTSDKNNDIIITGTFSNSINFNGIGLDGHSYSDIFVAKYDSSGNILWAHSGGSNGFYNSGNAVAVNSNNDIFIAGTISDTATFDNLTVTSIGGADAIIAKYDVNGNIIWIEQAGGQENYDYGNDISIDKNDNIYVTGEFSGTAFWRNFQLTSVENSDIFIAKYNASGIPMWVDQDSKYPTNAGIGISVDDAENVSVAGNMLIGDFDDVYIGRFNKDGKKIWSTITGGNSNDQAGGIANSLNGDMVISGSFSDTASFGSKELVSIGYSDVFLGKIPVPQLTFSPGILNFNNAAPGENITKSIIYSNPSKSTLHIYNTYFVDSKKQYILESKIVDSIAAGGIENLNIKFLPNIPGRHTAELIIESDAPTSPDSVFITGNVINPSYSFSSDSLNFGNVDINNTTGKILTIKNNGSTNLFINNLVLSGENISDFSLPGLIRPDTIPPLSSKNLTINFTPSTVGIKSGFLIVETNSIYGPDTISLTGTGIFRTVTFSTRQLDYGNKEVGSSVQKSITITNNGSVDIIFSNKLLTNKTDFSLLDSSVPDTLHPEISRQYRINFNPQSPGNKTGKIIFVSNSEGGADTLTLTGNGTSALMVLSSNQIDFGSVDINHDSISALKISNTGNGSLIISNYSIAGSNPGDFTISNSTVPDTILSGNSGDVNIKFAPQTSGNKTASLLIASNTNSLPDTVRLSGKGASVISVEIPANNNVDQNTNLTANPPQGFNFTNNELYYRRSGESSYQQTDLTLSNDIYTGVIPASYSTIRGIQYYIEFSEPGYTVTYPANNPVNNPAYIAVSVPEYTYPTVIKKSVYQMISIPLLISNPVIDSVLTSSYGAYDNTKWRVLRWNPGTNSYSEYPELNGNLVPGNAFWLIENEGKSFNIKNAVTVSSSGSYSVNLQPGWNQVGDPYAFPVDWDSVLNTGQVQLPIHWNSDIEDYEINQRVLQPWDGYWVFNPDTGIVSITFRPIASSGVPKLKSLQAAELKSDEFMVQLRAKIENTNIVDEENYVGMLESAKEGKDRYDVLAPPSITGNLNFNVVSGDTEYAENIVSPSKEGAYWDIESSTNQKDKNLIVEIDTTTMPGGFKMWFLDRERKVSIPINGDKIGIPIPRSGKGSYRIITGNEAYAKENSENISLVPLEYSLSQNYPNPFNPTTNINYQLKELSKVTLEIFNILGQRIRVLINNQVENPGQYRVMWDGTNGSGNRVATGVYIYRLRANSFVSSKKMILLK